MSSVMRFTPFTSATIFDLAVVPESLTVPEQLQACLEEFRMGELTDRTVQAAGFTDPLDRDDSDQLFYAIDGYLFLTYRVMTRQVDSFTVSQKAEQRMDELAEKGTEITETLRADITETTRQELLPFFPVKLKDYRAMVMFKQQIIVVDETSDKAAENFTRFLRKAIGTLQTSHLRVVRKPFEEMASWLQDEVVEVGDGEERISHWPSWISLIENKLLHTEGLDDSDVKAKLQSFDLNAKSTQQVLETMGVTQAPLVFWDTRDDDESKHVRVMIATLVSQPETKNSRKVDMRLKGIKFNLVRAIRTEDPQEVNGLAFLMAQSFEYVISRLVNEFSGRWQDTGDDFQAVPLEVSDKPVLVWLDELSAEVSYSPTPMHHQEEEDADALIESAKAFLAETRRGSVSALQRQFKIGYSRAARIMEALENMNVVTAPGHNGQREVLLAPEVC